jgi:hypothetical protein
MIDPTTVPRSAIDTVIPSVASVRLKYADINLVVPEITAVSKPKRRLPRAETTVANNRFLFTSHSLLTEEVVSSLSYVFWPCIDARIVFEFEEQTSRGNS